MGRGWDELRVLAGEGSTYFGPGLGRGRLMLWVGWSLDEGIAVEGAGGLQMATLST